MNVENVPIIMGSLMSGTTIAAAEAAIIPAGVPQISPTATSPAMTFLEDNGLVFRIVPSDNYQGEILAKMVMDEGIKKVALTFVNNDYGVGIGKHSSTPTLKPAVKSSPRRNTKKRRIPTVRNLQAWPRVMPRRWL